MVFWSEESKVVNALIHVIGTFFLGQSLGIQLRYMSALNLLSTVMLNRYLHWHLNH